LNGLLLNRPTSPHRFRFLDHERFIANNDVAADFEADPMFVAGAAHAAAQHCQELAG